jgi:hypothetical protein
MRIRGKHLIGLAAIALMSLPVWARAESTTLIVDTPTQVGETSLQPGQYDLKVEPNGDHVTVYHNGKEVATAPCQWITLDKKSSQTLIQTKDGHVTEIDFSGKTAAVQLR